MRNYEASVVSELKLWQRKMSRRPSLIGSYTKGIQVKINSLIPDKIHDLLTTAIKNMIKATLIGSEYTTRAPIIEGISLEGREKLVRDKLQFYRKAAAVEGAGTGAGGLFLGIADFPLLLSLKIKFLFEVAGLYGFNIKDYRERLYILHLFQLAFSSEIRRKEVYEKILNWEETVKSFPPEMKLESLDWHLFQQEYRDHIDLVKMFQLMPGIGAVVGLCANYSLMNKLGETAINGYRLRLLK